jgi:hypothetical protein
LAQKPATNIEEIMKCVEYYIKGEESYAERGILIQKKRPLIKVIPPSPIDGRSESTNPTYHNKLAILKGYINKVTHILL